MTAVTLLAAAALGAAVATQGCTVSSGTVNDTDGGTQSSSGTSGTSGGSTDTDAGSEGGSNGGETCDPNQYKASEDATCQACLSQKCCADLKRCFEITVEGEALNCEQLAECVNNAADELEFNACVDGSDPAVREPFGQVVGCAETQCASECSTDAPDGGS